MQPYRFTPPTVALVALLSVTSPVWAVDFRRDDANTDAAVDVSDVVLTLGYLFTGDSLSCADAADVNDDSAVDLSDSVSLLSFLFLGGTAPAAPGLECGLDPTSDEHRKLRRTSLSSRKESIVDRMFIAPDGVGRLTRRFWRVRGGLQPTTSGTTGDCRCFRLVLGT